MREKKLLPRLLILICIITAIMVGLIFYELSAIKKVSSPKKSSTPTQASSSAKITGPGGCQGVDQCLKYCQDNPDKCAK